LQPQNKNERKKMITMKKEQKIEESLASMSVEELKARLAEYMKNDASLKPRLVTIEVRLIADFARRRYDVILIDEEGEETPVKFSDRCSRLIYIYTLLHPHGYQRRKPAGDNYRALSQLYNLLFFMNSETLLKTINSTGYEHFLSHYVAQSRKAIREASPLAAPLAIDRPQAHSGKILIPFVEQGGNVIIDSSLRNIMSNL